MKSKITIRYLGAAMAVCAMLLPLSSQADVQWSLSFGPDLQRHHDHHGQQRQEQHYYKSRSHRHGHHQPQKLQSYYWRHRAHTQHHYYDYYDANSYGFIPRHHLHYRSSY